jgi:prepilin-type N-terminal cleavage/methylation domain-containing protein/prepilin-type processing-associated H-X9-DG protein
MELKHRVPAFSAPRAGFSLIELLLVVAILGILIGLMLPSLQTVREGARRVHCANSLRQIGIAMRLSADFRRGLFPDASKTGHFSYRMAPGLRTPNDPDALPEVFGLEAVYVKEGVLGEASGVWVCPSQNARHRSYRNTYAFSIAKLLSRRDPPNQRTTIFVWDNYSLYPGLSGFRGPFAGYGIPAAQRTTPHAVFPSGSTAYNALYLDGHVNLVVH